MRVAKLILVVEPGTGRTSKLVPIQHHCQKNCAFQHEKNGVYVSDYVFRDEEETGNTAFGVGTT
jgi:hypothetical protein